MTSIPPESTFDMAKIFITGVTGYIAGDCLYTLTRAHPEYEYSALVRTQEKSDVVKKAYPSIRIVLGSLDDSELLEKEAASADIVLRPYFCTAFLDCADPSQMQLMPRTTREQQRP